MDQHDPRPPVPTAWEPIQALVTRIGFGIEGLERVLRGMESRIAEMPRLPGGTTDETTSRDRSMAASFCEQLKGFAERLDVLLATVDQQAVRFAELSGDDDQPATLAYTSAGPATATGVEIRTLQPDEVPAWIKDAAARLFESAAELMDAATLSCDRGDVQDVTAAEPVHVANVPIASVAASAAAIETPDTAPLSFRAGTPNPAPEFPHVLTQPLINLMLVSRDTLQSGFSLDEGAGFLELVSQVCAFCFTFCVDVAKVEVPPPNQVLPETVRYKLLRRFVDTAQEVLAHVHELKCYPAFLCILKQALQSAEKMISSDLAAPGETPS